MNFYHHPDFKNQFIAKTLIFWKAGYPLDKTEVSKILEFVIFVKNAFFTKKIEI